MSSKPLNQPFFFEKTWKTRQFLSPTSLQEMIVLLENLSWTFIMSYPKTAPDISSSSTEKPNQMTKPIPETWKAWNEPNSPLTFFGVFSCYPPEVYSAKAPPLKRLPSTQKVSVGSSSNQPFLGEKLSLPVFNFDGANFRVFFSGMKNRSMQFIYYKSLTCMFRAFWGRIPLRRPMQPTLPTLPP